MDSRQYRHTWVNGIIGRASVSVGWRIYWGIREMISGGSLLIGCNMFRKEGINLRISCALVSRLSI